MHWCKIEFICEFATPDEGEPKKGEEQSLDCQEVY